MEISLLDVTNLHGALSRQCHTSIAQKNSSADLNVIPPIRQLQSGSGLRCPDNCGVVLMCSWFGLVLLVPPEPLSESWRAGWCHCSIIIIMIYVWYSGLGTEQKQHKNWASHIYNSSSVYKITRWWRPCSGGWWGPWPAGCGALPSRAGRAARGRRPSPPAGEKYEICLERLHLVRLEFKLLRRRRHSTLLAVRHRCFSFS